MKINLTILLLISILIISCDKEEYDGQFPLEQFSKELLPENDNIYYISSNDSSNTFELSTENNYFINESYGGDSRGWGWGHVIYSGDFEHQIKSYNSNRFRISYHLYVESSTWMWNILECTIDSDMSNEKFYFDIITEENYEGLPSLSYNYLIEFNDTTIYDVYSSEYEGENYYFQIGKGLIRFEYDDELWTISE